MSAERTVTWRLLNLELALEEPEAVLRERACRELGLEPDQLRGFRFARKALDVRDRRRGRAPRFIVHTDLVLAVGCEPPRLTRALRSGRLVAAPAAGSLTIESVHDSLTGGRRRAVVVGSGPAGMFAALPLALAGVQVTLLERGSRLERRSRELVRFHRTRLPDPESNLLFGEGGAGTYSDGKLATRVDDELEVPILEDLVAAGAPAEILYDSRAHIGTDRLHSLLPRLRARLEACGVEFVWNVRLERLVLEDAGRGRRVRAVETSVGELDCDLVVLATGHSARDTWATLVEQGLPIEAKPFQLGVRVEHPQELIDEARFGVDPALRCLGAAAYNLVCKAGDGLQSAHSFCMCPGGRIVASVNEPGLLCTNGMSNSTHSSAWANAAIVTTFGPREFGPGALAGVEFQRRLEERFFEAGGSDYSAPAQRVPDFLAGRASDGELRSSYPLGLRPGRIDELLGEASQQILARALRRFDRHLPGFAGPKGLLVGVESRSSGPVRVRRERGTARVEGFSNLSWVGEGAGFAGGIMSAALDGVRGAQGLLRAGVRA
ncbi:MAG: FAD-dependent monooxygenase [Planctomycetota bacterium]|nr:FAD-dependent monooxygenase [Planctomycetota bacterium]